MLLCKLEELYYWIEFSFQNLLIFKEKFQQNNFYKIVAMETYRKISLKAFFCCASACCLDIFVFPHEWDFLSKLLAWKFEREKFSSSIPCLILKIRW